jgi:hypothetical protein
VLRLCGVAQLLCASYQLQLQLSITSDAKSVGQLSGAVSDLDKLRFIFDAGGDHVPSNSAIFPSLSSPESGPSSL